MLFAFDPASIGTILLAVAALMTAVGAYVTNRRTAVTAAATAQAAAMAAREAAQTGEDDSYVNRSLSAMQALQAVQRDENTGLRARIEEQRQELERVYAMLVAVRAELVVSNRQGAECRALFDEVSARLALLEGKPK